MDPNYYAYYLQQQQQQQQQAAQLTPEQLQQQQQYYYYYYYQMTAAAAAQQQQATDASNASATPAVSLTTDTTSKAGNVLGKPNTYKIERSPAEKESDNSKRSGRDEEKEKEEKEKEKEAETNRRGKRIPIYKDKKTMNLDERLYRGITRSEYYNSLSKYTTWEELVQEGCETVKYMAPYVASADCEGSSAFCVMYKMFSMGGGLSVKQMNQMLSHKNPYIKAIGLMYLRLSSPPEGLWDWFEPLLADESVIRFHPRRETACGKLGKFCADLLREMKFQELTLPRIPVPIYKKIIEKLDSYIEDNDIDFSLPRDESDADDNDDNDERGSEQGRRSGGSRRDSRDTHGSRRRKRRRSRSRSSDSSGSDRSSRDHSRRRSSHGHHHHHHRHHHSRHSRSRSRSRSPVQRQRSPTQAGAKCEGSKKDVPVVAPPQSTMSERLAKIKAMYSVGSNGTGSPSLSSSSPGAGVDYKKDSLSSDTIVLGKSNY